MSGKVNTTAGAQALGSSDEGGETTRLGLWGPMAWMFQSLLDAQEVNQELYRAGAKFTQESTLLNQQTAVSGAERTKQSANDTVHSLRYQMGESIAGAACGLAAVAGTMKFSKSDEINTANETHNNLEAWETAGKSKGPGKADGRIRGDGVQEREPSGRDNEIQTGFKELNPKQVKATKPTDPQYNHEGKRSGIDSARDARAKMDPDARKAYDDKLAEEKHDASRTLQNAMQQAQTNVQLFKGLTDAANQVSIAGCKEGEAGAAASKGQHDADHDLLGVTGQFLKESINLSNDQGQTGAHATKEMYRTMNELIRLETSV